VIRFAYPNVAKGQFIGCGRYLAHSSRQVLDSRYKVAEPKAQNVSKIMAAAALLAPVSQEAIVYEMQDEPAHGYQGDSLDFAFFLAQISCSRRLRLDSVSDSRDIWCTGRIELVENKYPFLEGLLEQAQFDVKLAAFLDDSENTHRDPVFIVSVANMTPKNTRLCQQYDVSILSFSEFQTLTRFPEELFAKKIVIRLQGNELEPLVQELFESPKATLASRSVTAPKRLQFLVNNDKLNYWYLLALFSFYFVMLYAYSDNILNAYESDDILISISYAVFFLTFPIIGYSITPKRAHAQIPEKSEAPIFQEIGKIDSSTAWVRDERDDLCNIIRQAIGKPIVFVGSSGVGKSILLETQVVPSLQREGWQAIFLSNYGPSLAAQLRNILRRTLLDFPDREQQFLHYASLDGIDRNTKILFIFDQFEQFLSTNSQDNKDGGGEREWFRAFLANATTLSNIRPLIVVRREWYYELRFLGKFVPSPVECFHLAGWKMDKDGSDRPLILEKLEMVTKNPEAAQLILDSLERENEILPVEVQMVGFILENEAREIGEIDSEYYLKELGGKEGVIYTYFRTYLDAASDRDITLKILFALSVETVLRSQQQLSQIADVIHESQRDVSKCLLFLVEHGLVRATATGKYELAHDYLAEKFHDLSGAELDPVERDNIIFFWDEMRRTSESLPITRSQTDTKKRFVFSDYFIAVSAILLLVRLMWSIYDINWSWFNILSPYQTAKIGIDIYYLPIFISLLAWNVYVTLLYRRFFLHLNESTLGRLLSKFTVVNGTAGILMSTLIPYGWILFIGLCGFPIGWKLYRLSRLSGLPKVSSHWFRQAGMHTMINMLIAMGIGLAFIYYTHSAELSKNVAERINVIFMLIAIVMVYFMSLSTSLFTTRGAVSKMMGLIDRGKVRLQRMTFDLSRS